MATPFSSQTVTRRSSSVELSFSTVFTSSVSLSSTGWAEGEGVGSTVSRGMTTGTVSSGLGSVTGGFFLPVREKTRASATISTQGQATRQMRFKGSAFSFSKFSLDKNSFMAVSRNPIIMVTIQYCKRLQFVNKKLKN